MELGAFSISLAVKDLDASRAFYEKLGFKVTGGGDGYHIMINGEHIIGLFQGMFEKNILTFNPGLDNRTNRVEDFTDVRAIQRQLEERGITSFVQRADENTTGPASLMIEDPDGNPILIDQFF